MMKYTVLIALHMLITIIALPRVKRQAYQLPDGAELIVGEIKTTFTCEGLRYGYYADIDNNCQIFHICNPITYADGAQESQQYSFFCGNLTIFNQLTLSCAYPEDSVPCEKANEFYYVNDALGNPDAPFLTDEDVDRANQIIHEKRVQK